MKRKLKKLLTKIKKGFIWLLSFVPDHDPDEYGKRKYRAKRDKYRKYH